MRRGFLLPGSEVSLIFAALMVQKGLTPYTRTRRWPQVFVVSPARPETLNRTRGSYQMFFVVEPQPPLEYLLREAHHEPAIRREDDERGAEAR